MSPDRQQLTDSKGIKNREREREGKRENLILDSFPLALPSKTCSSSSSHNTVVTQGPASVKFSQTNTDKYQLEFIIMEEILRTRLLILQPVTISLYSFK